MFSQVPVSHSVQRGGMSRWVGMSGGPGRVGGGYCHGGVGMSRGGY